MSIVPLELEQQIKRDSILSAHKKNNDLEYNRKLLEAAPPDPYHLVHVVFFFLGMSVWTPMSFFLTAQDYWMYKFRDTSQINYDLNKKTLLQQNFTSIQPLITTIPASITNLLISRYGHKISIKTRLIGTGLVLFITFLVFTGFVKMDTDSWQLGFFVLTMAVITILTLNASVLNITSFSVMSRFPKSYLKTNQYGTNVIGIFSAVLQIISLSTNGTSTTVALIYFIIATVLVGCHAALMYFAFKLPRFTYFLGDTEQDVQKPTQTMSQLVSVAKRVWPIAVAAITGHILYDLSGTSITSMIVSEQYPNTLWSRKYFIPVINFLVANTVCLVGCALAGPYITTENGRYFVIIDVCRQLFIGPLTLFCNLKTRHRHLPTLFPHDYQFIIITNVFYFVMSFSYTCRLMSIPNLMQDDPEQGFLFMTALSGTLTPLLSPLASVWVNII